MRQHESPGGIWAYEMRMSGIISEDIQITSEERIKSSVCGGNNLRRAANTAGVHFQNNRSNHKFARAQKLAVKKGERWLR